jgi:ribulose-5-phosphate 4-epimerase/fuculose-1-phosphate aldolase
VVSKEDIVDELRMKVAISCRILGMLGLVRGTTGHVSARIPGSEEMWIRCRGGDEYGLTFTDLHNIRRVDFDGKGPGMDNQHASPNETAIHGEIYRAHPEVQAVVHAHPIYALRCGITDIAYKPFFAGYDPSALDIVMKGVPIFERAATVTNKSMAADMLAAMGNRDVLLMRGHGITVSGNTVESATSQAIRFDELSHIMWDVATSGMPGREISDQDKGLYDRSNRPPREERSGWAALEGVETWGWKHYVRLLKVNNIGLPE